MAMHFLRRTLSRKDAAYTHELAGEIFVIGPDSTKPTMSPEAATSTGTISTESTPSTSSFISTPMSPTFHLPTLHVTKESSDPSLTLHLRSRARSAENTPTFYGGDIISGEVVLNLTPKEAQHVTSVVIELQGETLAAGAGTPHRFLSKRETLWTSSGSPDGNKRGLFSEGKVESFFQTIRKSGDRQVDVEEPSNTGTSSRRHRPRVQLEPSRAHVWPFELSLPRRISSSTKASPRTPVSASTSRSPYLRPAPVDMEVTRTQLVNEEAERGGVRAETTGYGVGWDDITLSYQKRDGNRYPSYNERDASVEERKGSDQDKRKHNAEAQTSVSDGEAFGRTLATSVDERDTFQLPPSFSERTSAAYLEYRLVVIVHKRGPLRENQSLQIILHVPYRSYVEPGAGLCLRATRADRNVSYLLGPTENPDGWKLMPEVVMQLQPKVRRSGKAKVNGLAKEIGLKLALSRPLCYSRGTSIPFRITVSIPRPSTLISKDKVGMSKYSPPSSFSPHSAMFSVPSFAIGVAPLFYKSHSTSSLTSRAVIPHVEVRDLPRRSPTPRQESQPQPSVSFVPSAAAIASSVRLVRAIHVGPDASDDSKSHRESASFLQPIAAAIIYNNGRSAGTSVVGDDLETDPELEGWATKRGRLVRTFVGEIPLKEDVKPSFIFSHFVLQYAVVLFPFEAPGFSPSSNEPLWSEPVVITTHLTRSKSASTSGSRAKISHSRGISEVKEKNTEVVISCEQKQEVDTQAGMGSLVVSHLLGNGPNKSI